MSRSAWFGAGAGAAGSVLVAAFLLARDAPDAECILLEAEDDATEYFLEERWFAAALELAEAHGADVVTSSVVLYEGYERTDVDGHPSVMARAWALAAGNGVIGLQGTGNDGHDADPSTLHMLPPAGVPAILLPRARCAGSDVRPGLRDPGPFASGRRRDGSREDRVDGPASVTFPQGAFRHL
ncbi:MAG: hypothetical protein PVH00_10185 [Gemmatimonadota bacterium]|jgi:hypothetical protein